MPPFLLTVAALEVHMIEEYLTHFGPAMSRLFNISWSERSFLMIFAFIGPAIYSLTALGLFRQVPRWAGVPWCLRSGKNLPDTATEILVELKPLPQRLFADSAPVTGRAI